MPFSQYSSQGGSTRWGRSSSATNTDDPYSVEAIDRQIANAKLRAQDSGYSANPDKRNWFERWANLPQGQSGFMDTLEIIDRPREAIMNMIDKAPTGERTAGDAFMRGLTGADHITGSQLLKNRGFESGIGRTVLGTALDIATDPITYIPGGVFVKGTKAVGRPVVNGVRRGYTAIEGKVPGFKRFRENTVAPILTQTKDGLGSIFNRDYKIDETLSGGKSDFLRNAANQTENARRFMQEESVKGIADTAKMTGGISTGADVGRIMEVPLKQFDEIQAFELPGGGTTTSRRELQNRINDSRNRITELESDLKNKFYTPKSIDQMTVGDKAFRIDANGKRATDSKAIEIEEVRNGVGGKEIRLKGDDAFIPASSVKPVGVVRTTELGSLNEQISATAQQLSKVDKDLRRLYGKIENKKLNTIKSRNLSSLEPLQVRRGFNSTNPEVIGLNQQADTIAARLREIKVGKMRKKKDYSPEQMEKIASQRAFNDLSKSPAFNLLLKQRDEFKTQLDDLRTQSVKLKENTSTQIKRHQDEIEQHRVSMQNPIVQQREIPRVEREISTDANVQTAAQQLLRSNQELRQYALDNGINIPELEGYMTHVLSKAERELRKSKRVSSVDVGRYGSGNPNKKLLQERQYKGSVEDINEQVGRNVFEANAYFATANGQKRLIDYIQAVKFRKDVLSNPDFAVKFEKGMEIPANAEVIDTANYTFLKDGEEIIKDMPATETIGGKYIVTKAAKSALDRYQRLNTDEGTRAFLKAFDSLTNTWKKFALFSFGYHARNAIGGMFNNYVGGMNMINGDLLKYTSQAAKDVTDAVRGKESVLFREYREQGLGSSALSNIEFRPFGEPEKALEKTITERSKSTGGKVATRLNPLRAFETSREVGHFIDQTNRFGMYKYAREKLKLSPEQAAAKVKETQFDYTNLSPIEQNIFARVIPFYRWMRNNIPYQIKQFINDPRKYMNANKLRMNAAETSGIENESVPDWMKEQFAIPLTDNKFLALGLPLNDLNKITNPVKMGVDSLNSLIKTPIELTTNRNFFYNSEIRKFDGQEKQFRVPGTGIEFGVPIKTAYALEQTTGQIGRGFSQYLQQPEDKDQDTQFRMPRLGINSLVKSYDQEKSKYFEKLEQLRALQDYLDYIEQQTGQAPRTVRQING